MATLPEQIERLTREWDGWSRGEQRNMDAVVADVLAYAADGVGEGFVARFYVEHVAPRLDVTSGRTRVMVDHAWFASMRAEVGR